MELKQGIFKMTWEQYRKIPALNNSVLVHGDKSMAHLKTALDEPYSEPTQAMNVGQALHLLTFEPDRFSSQVYQDLKLNKNTTKYKEWKAELLEREPEAIILSATDIDNVYAMHNKMMVKSHVKRVLESGWPERVIIWKDPDYGFLCKAKLDWITPDRGVYDLKKSRSAGEKFRYSVYNYKYHWQAFWYLRGIHTVTGEPHGPFMWITWEDQPPHEGQIVVCDSQAIIDAEVSIRPILRGYAEGLESGVWPGYPDEPYYMDPNEKVFQSFGQDNEDLGEDLYF